jgi:hypothetical protein
MGIIVDDLDLETEIVWLEDPLRYPYLRETASLTTRPKQFPTKWGRDQGFRVIGYAVQRRPDDAYGIHTYIRRFWFLKSYDQGADWGDDDPAEVYKTGGPAEAVEPRSIRVGIESFEWRP